MLFFFLKNTHRVFIIRTATDILMNYVEHNLLVLLSKNVLTCTPLKMSLEIIM